MATKINVNCEYYEYVYQVCIDYPKMILRLLILFSLDQQSHNNMYSLKSVFN